STLISNSALELWFSSEPCHPLAQHRSADRILDFEPRPAVLVRHVATFRHDAFEPELAGCPNTGGGVTSRINGPAALRASTASSHAFGSSHRVSARKSEQAARTRRFI